jgi:hypothetical protein
MKHDQIALSDEKSAKIEEWFSETYGTIPKSAEEIQLLILYKLHQLEERLKVVEYQTKTHWAN